MCVSTRFPEAVPFRNIKAKAIVRALTKFLTLVGLLSSIQSDQDSNFMSGIFQQVMHELGITQFRSSMHHPQSQGALERWHQTLKNMTSIYCFETEKDWGKGIHLLLFATRESVQESLGFSLIELVFGHTVRGPFKLLKEKSSSRSTESINLLQPGKKVLALLPVSGNTLNFRVFGPYAIEKKLNYLNYIIFTPDRRK